MKPAVTLLQMKQLITNVTGSPSNDSATAAIMARPHDAPACVLWAVVDFAENGANECIITADDSAVKSMTPAQFLKRLDKLIDRCGQNATVVMAGWGGLTAGWGTCTAFDVSADGAIILLRFE